MCFSSGRHADDFHSYIPPPLNVFSVQLGTGLVWMQTFARLALVCVPAWSWPLCHSLQTLSQACSAVRRQSESHEVTDDLESLPQLILTGYFTYDTDVVSFQSTRWFFFSNIFFSHARFYPPPAIHATAPTSIQRLSIIPSANRAVRSCLCRKIVLICGMRQMEIEEQQKAEVSIAAPCIKILNERISAV